MGLAAPQNIWVTGIGITITGKPIMTIIVVVGISIVIGGGTTKTGVRLGELLFFGGMIDTERDTKDDTIGISHINVWYS